MALQAPAFNGLPTLTHTRAVVRVRVCAPHAHTNTRPHVCRHGCFAAAVVAQSKLAVLHCSAGADAFQQLWARIERNAALMISAALPSMRLDCATLSLPPESAFEVCGLVSLVGTSLVPCNEITSCLYSGPQLAP